MSILHLEGLSYRYPAAPKAALDDVTLRIEPGEFCLVAGMSASGKSTLLRVACGLAPHFYGGEFAGRVSVDGLDTREHGPSEIGMVAGTVFQDPETQLVMNTVRAELALGLENHGLAGAAVARGVEEAALALGIAHLLDRPTRELSGGEKQRVVLGAALASRPRLVLLDEPTSQLDPVAGDELIWQLRRLNQEWETAVVLAEHRLERCLAAADRVIVLDDGRIVCDRDPRGFLDWAAEHAPALQTPGARLMTQAGLRPPPSGVRQARASLRAHGLLRDDHKPDPAPASPARRLRFGQRGAGAGAGAALALEGVWHEITDGAAILRGVDLRVKAGERVAIMGRNGAGKSTLLRHAAGLLEPTRGHIRCAGRFALLLQNPGDYFLHERVIDEVSPVALDDAGLAAERERHPRDLSGGERQRLALAIVLDGDSPPAILGLDEPTRGMDRAAKAKLAVWLVDRAQEGMAIIVATHDAEFAAAFAQRVVLMADGRVLADGSVSEVLTGGWYFATETARILGGSGGALTPEQGAEWLRGRRSELTRRQSAAMAKGVGH